MPSYFKRSRPAVELRLAFQSKQFAATDRSTEVAGRIAQLSFFFLRRSFFGRGFYSGVCVKRRAADTAAEIDAHLERTLGRVTTESAAYYFRYIANAITATEKRNTILRAFAEQEEMLAANGSIIALGRRFVAAR